MSYLATLAQVREELTNINASTANVNEAYVFSNNPYASDRLEMFLGYTFEPLIATKTFNARGFHISDDGTEMELRTDAGFAPLLAVTSITMGDGTVLANDEYTLISADDRTPYSSILIDDAETSSRWYDRSGTARKAISIAGVWGYHKSYAAAWSTGSTLNDADGVDADDTSFTVTSGAVFSPGQLIKIGSEYCRVAAVASNVLTVQRGQNGSTAAAHSNGAAVTIWQPDSRANRFAARLIALTLSKRGSFETSRIDGTGIVISKPDDLPRECLNILNEFNTWTVA